ncbi:MAG: lipopolysaccharide biosynthesis protein, partial [Promethearchaeota archaeon]
FYGHIRENLGIYLPNVILIAGVNLTLNEIKILYDFYMSGGNIFFFAGLNSSSDATFLKYLNVVKGSGDVTLTQKGEGTALLYPINNSDPLVTGIQWSSSPEAKVFEKISGFSDNVVPVLDAYGQNTTLMFRIDNIANISSPTNITGRFVGFNIVYTKNDNWDAQLWLYMPYFLYRTIKWMSNQSPLSFSDWSKSPVPHTKEKIMLALYLVLIFAIALLSFMYSKKKSKIPLEVKYEEYIQKLKKEFEEKEKKKNKKKWKRSKAKTNSPESEEGNNNSNNNSKNTHEEQNESEINKETSQGFDSKEYLKQKILNNKWEQIGLHRQISSFFIQLFMGLLVAVPYLLLSMYIYPRFVQPFPQTQGWVNWTTTFFAALYTVFDMGTSTALTKFFSQYRIKNPAEAIKYAQIYIWWQMITGCVQISIVSSLGIYVLGPSYLGHMTWFFVLSSLAQFPGMVNVITLMLEAMQRFDVKITAEMVLGATTTNLFNYLSIIIFRNIFKHNWMYGEAFGSGVGMVIGTYIAGLGNFLIYILIFKKLGYSVSTLFRVDFKKKNIKEALGFGSKLVLGNVWVPLVSLLEITLISIYVLNYNAEMGYLAMMRNITTITQLLGTFYASMMPGISEAHGNKKMVLTEYYIVEGFKWTNFILFFLIAALASVGDKVIIIFAGPQWYGALKYLPILLIFGSFEPIAWYADKVFQGTNNTKYNMIIWIIEQGTRSLFLILIFVGFQMKYLWTVYLAYIPGIFAKDVAAIIFMRKKIVKFKPYWMHTTIGPLIGALIIYIANRLLILYIHGDSIVVLIILLLVILFGGLFFYIFITAFLGAWDRNTLDEFKRGLGMIATVKFVFIMLQWFGELGYKLSPFKEKFRVDIFDKASEEAKELTLEKELLII